MSLRDRLEKYWLDWRTFPADAALSYRNNGFPGIWKALAPRTVHRVFRHGRLIVFAQALDRVADILPPPGVRIAPVQASEWPALGSIVTRRDLNRFQGLVAAGRHCLVAWRGARPIGYAWVAERAGPDVSMVPLPLPDDAAYLWDLYVLPTERCNGIGSALATARLNIARARGFREGWRTIAPSNRASLRTLERSGAGARMVGELRYLKLVTRMYVRFTPRSGPSIPAN
jgi:ribosomal protein S18 acetylase RimI-like enzyme